MGFGLDDLFAGAVSAFGQAKQNKWAAGQAQKQMDFQERMSSTAHQREVMDLRAAGLNPLLSVNAGASAPSGAMASGDSPVGAGVSSAFASRRLKADLAMQAEQIRSIGADVDLKRAQKRQIEAGLPVKDFVGGVASDARALYQALQDRIRGRPQRSTVIERVPGRVSSAKAYKDALAEQQARSRERARRFREATGDRGYPSDSTRRRP